MPEENGNDINILYIVKELITVASKNLAGLSEIWPCTFDRLQRLTNIIIFHKRMNLLLLHMPLPLHCHLTLVMTMMIMMMMLIILMMILSWWLMMLRNIVELTMWKAIIWWLTKSISVVMVAYNTTLHSLHNTNIKYITSNTTCHPPHLILLGYFVVPNRMDMEMNYLSN